MKYRSAKILYPSGVFTLAAAVVVLFAACKPFTDDLDRFLHYWTNLIILKADGANDWKELKDTVAAAPDNGVIIVVGEFKATTDSGNNGTIVITKRLTIQGTNSGGGGTLNANRAVLGTSAHRIFTVATGASLTLNNLTLKNGKAEAPLNYGGGILCGGSLTMHNVTVTDCQASHGGGISLWSKGYIKLTGCTIKNNSAGNIYGGGICIDDFNSDEYLTVEFSGNNVIENNRAVGTRGKGVYLKGLKSQLIFNNCSFNTNAASSPQNQDIWISGGYGTNQGRITVYGTLTVKDLSGSDTELSVLVVIPHSNQLLFGDITNGTPPNHTKFLVRYQGSPLVLRRFDNSGKVVP